MTRPGRDRTLPQDIDRRRADAFDLRVSRDDAFAENPAASSGSWPGVRMVIETLLWTRQPLRMEPSWISSGSSTASSSSRAAPALSGMR